jgi:4-hydroxybutyryl-CoA dehydratase/vinylacetyl-CoA-Delta-isomerase
MHGNIAVPNPLIANKAKLHFASKYHNFVELIQDISGGIIATSPDKKDWENPDIHDLFEHYLGGSDKYSTLDRLKMVHGRMRHVCSHESAFTKSPPSMPKGPWRPKDDDLRRIAR